MTTGICVNGFDGPQGGSMLFTELFLQGGWVRIVSKDLLGFLSTATTTLQLPWELTGKKRKGKNSTMGKYIQIHRYPAPSMLVLSGKLVSKMNYNGGNLLMYFLTFANTTGHHFLSSFFFLWKVITYTVASDFKSIKRIKTSCW